MCKTAFAVATKVSSGIITSSPFLSFNAFKDKNNAYVALDTHIANFAPVNFANNLSNSRNFGPSVSNGLSNELIITFLSFAVILGTKKGTRVGDLLNILSTLGLGKIHFLHVPSINKFIESII